MRVVPLALLLLVAACGGSGAEPSTPPTTIVPGATRTPLAAPTIEGEATFFSTPDGNVACEVQPAYARCDAKAHTWTAPKKPSDCHNKWGSAIDMAAGSKPEFICWFGESPLGTKRVVRMGQALQVGLMTCRVIVGGVECSAEGRSFRVTRAAYRLA